MATLLFMPWCRIDRRYSAGDVEIVPFDVDNDDRAMDADARRAATAVLGSYRTIEGQPVRRCAVLRYGDRDYLADLNGDELGSCYDLADLVCFGGLAIREFFMPGGRYCNADCLILYAQNFRDLDTIALSSRRRDGRTVDARMLGEIAFSEPPHVATVPRVSVDGPLVEALVRYRGRVDAREWTRWRNAIWSFNRANTDGDTVRWQTEWVLMAGAFQEILDARSDAEDVAERFARSLVPLAELEAAGTLRSAAGTFAAGRSLRYEWMREFYGTRGELAHGRAAVRRRSAWEPLEHLVLAAIALPLLVKRFLQDRAGLVLGEEELACMDAFEALAEQRFFEVPPDCRGSTDSWWIRLVTAKRLDRARERVAEALERRGNPWA
jgi:hypothetical protein